MLKADSGCYSAYGLGVRSDLSLPEFIPAERGHDVVIRWAGTDTLLPDPSGKGYYIRVTSEEGVLFYQDVGVFLVRSGREVLISPAPGAEESLLRLYLVGTVMGVLLYQRGLFVLHASAVEIDGEVVAFMGASGAGKSSMAAALHTRGHRMVADDVTPVDLTAGQAMVYPAFPQVKLYPAIARALGYDAGALLPLDPTEKKHGCRLSHRFAEAQRPLRCIYVLAPEMEPGIDPIASQDALVELVRHSYPGKLLHSGGTRHFHQCVSLAHRAPIYRLNKPDDPSALGGLARAVEEHLQHGAQSGPAAFSSLADEDEMSLDYVGAA